MRKTQSKISASQNQIDFAQENDNYNFFVTNFEPYQVYKKLRQFTLKVLPEQAKDGNAILSALRSISTGGNKDLNFFKNLANTNGMKIEPETVTRMLMLKDLENFANSIVEVMLGRFSEDISDFVKPNKAQGGLDILEKMTMSEEDRKKL